eukprot:CAMPEP_0197505582 /NCGR_PEP_ID=MMETSP1312-20131121/4293_1 /TAXON_ID=464262 /ORGANISM="Genus nov. species nov., Strain RCC2335" /LENGTH=38 /DNA_ID= /DNA_START= /DNA_END= /DNA_ORIENTATION=
MALEPSKGSMLIFDWAPGSLFAFAPAGGSWGPVEDQHA